MSKNSSLKAGHLMDLSRAGIIDARFVPSAESIADMLTKPLQAVKLRDACALIGLRPFTQPCGA